MCKNLSKRQKRTIFALMSSKKKFTSRLLVSLLNGLSHFSMGTLYGVSDYLLYPVVSRVYRRKVVRQNLLKAFPEKSEAERRDIERRFYHWFCDLAMETVKVHGMSADELRQRMVWRNPEIVEQSITDGHDFALCFLSHYCNWEWCIGLPMSLHHSGMSQIYHPLRDDAFDEWFAQCRSAYGAVNIPMKETLRRLLQMRKEIKEGSYKTLSGNPVQGFFFGCIADQTPKKENIHLRVQFMNRDTAVFSGSEKLGRRFGMSFFYARFTRPRRGYYEAVFEPMEIDAETLANDEFAYTREYMRRLEQDMRQHPELWLWTHNRWKR